MTSCVTWDAVKDNGERSATHHLVHSDRIFWSRMSHVAFFTCICLQRFGVHFGTSSLSISVPVLFILSAVMIGSGRARIDIRSTTLFSSFAAFTAIAAMAATIWPDARMGFSLLSFLDVLFIYMMFCIRPKTGCDGAIIQDTFLFYARLCAALGIMQFALQFAGVQLYSFGEMFPSLDPILLEHDYNWETFLSYGSSLKRSNGFFLLEASIFSQLLAITIALDYFVLGRKKYLPLYAIAYMTSYSGTGLLSLGITMALISLVSVKNFSLSLLLAVVALLAGAVFAVAFPDQFAAFSSRIDEIGREGSSGTARYVSQFETIRTLANEMRSFVGYGPGSTRRSVYYMPGSDNPALQVFVDYGLVGALLFFAFFIEAIWNVKTAALSIILLMNFELGGGYLLFTPYTLLIVILGIWANEFNSRDALFGAPKPVDKQFKLAVKT